MGGRRAAFPPGAAAALYPLPLSFPFLSVAVFVPFIGGFPLYCVAGVCLSSPAAASSGGVVDLGVPSFSGDGGGLAGIGFGWGFFQRRWW